MKKKSSGLGFLLGLFSLTLSLSACTKVHFDAFFAQVDGLVPLQEVRYKLPIPKVDTTIQWYAPYRIFQNTTEFRSDTILHQERFNWKGLGDFLWEKYQELRKARKGGAGLDSLQGFIQGSEMKVIKDFTIGVYGQLTEQVPELVKVDEYRGQLQGVELESMIICPMALIQIQPISWEVYKRRAQRGRCRVRVHVVQDNYLNSYAQGPELSFYLQRHDLPQKIYTALQGFSGAFFEPLRLAENALDEEPSNWLVDVIGFETYLTDESVSALGGYVRAEPDIEPLKT